MIDGDGTIGAGNATHGRHGSVRAVVTDDRPPSTTPVIDSTAVALLLERAAERLGVRGPAEMSVTFVEPEAMGELNGTYRGIDGPTDVLSFPLDADEQSVGSDDGVLRLLGDIVICPQVAADNAPRHAGSFEDEIALLCVHGLLHLLGHDHAEVDEARVMADQEARLLAEFHRPLDVGTEIP